MSAHTPAPWHAVTVDECTVRAGGTTLFYGSVGNFPNAEADAAHLVHCVNAHADLVDALRGMVDQQCDDYNEDRRLDAARAVLAKVTA